jgi:DNA-binding transcriptional MerR regulator
MGAKSERGAAPGKSQFRIGEVSRLTATKPFVLRYWETEFPMLRPAKTPKGHRLYRREDIETIFEIKRLLYDEGFTIAGARKHLAEQKSDGDGPPASLTEDISGRVSRKLLLELREELQAILALLKSE